MKVSVPQAQIRRLFKEGYTVNAIGCKLKRPNTVIRRVLEGKDVPYYRPKSRSKKPNMCEFCGVREKTRTWSCDYCFKNAGNQVYPECTVNI